MKVLIIHPALPPYRLDLFNELARHVELRLAFLQDNLISQRFDQAKLRSQLRASHSLLNLRQCRWGFRRGVNQVIREFSPDVVVTSEYSPLSLYIGFCRRMGIIRCKHIVWSDDNSDLIEKDRFVRRVARRLTLLLTDGAVLLSAETKQVYLQKLKFKRNCAVVPILPNPERFRSDLTAALHKCPTIAEKHQLTGRKVLLFVGRLVRLKRIDRVINSFALAGMEHSSALVIVGDGPERANLERLGGALGLGERLIFAGRCEGEELLAWYGLADALVLASDQEAFGAVVGEALTAGVRVICSNVAGAKSLIQHERQGVVVDAADVGALAGAIKDQLSRVVREDVPGALIQLSAFEDSTKSFVAILDSSDL